MGLAQMYETKLREKGLGSAQVLLTHADLADRERYLNARSTLLTLLRLRSCRSSTRTTPSSTTRSSLATTTPWARWWPTWSRPMLLVILTDQKGLYSADPRKDPLPSLCTKPRPATRRWSHGRRRGLQHRPGGMITKILAARRAAGSGASTVIAWGREPDVLLRLARGEAIGTLLVAQTQKKQARKQWMADHLQLRGAVVVDAGAVAKLRDEGKSLLPIGMTAVEGEFSRGDVIAVRDAGGAEIARGLANYSSAEARLLCRKPSSEFERLLGYMAEPEMVHRDNLVLTR
jgi:glutamate 5-kinase